MEMDEPLAKVVEDQWNRTEFAQSYNEKKELESLMESLALLLQDPRGGDPTPAKIDEAFKMIDTFLAKAKSHQ